MAYVLEALICRGRPAWPPHINGRGRVEVGLDGDFNLVPITDEFRRELPSDLSDPVQGFERLTQPLVDVCEEMSRAAPVLYVHIEFHGGRGFHAVAVWEFGEVTFGPRFTANHPSDALTDRYQLVERREDMATSEGLRHLGVLRRPGLDEFASIGLGRHRWTEQWAADV